MYKFIKMRDENNEYDISDIEVVIDNGDATLNELLAQFEDFLLGCGYRFDGHIDIINDDIEYDETGITETRKN